MADEAQAATVATPAPTADSIMDPGARMEAILGEVLASETPELVEATATNSEAKPQESAALEAPPVVEAPHDVQLRKGFAKLAADKQRLVELQNEARTTTERAKSFETKASEHDRFLAELAADPAKALHARGGKELIDKLLDGIVAMEKSPAEKRLDEFERAQKAREQAETQRQQETQVNQWRQTVADHVTQASEKYDLVNTLGQHAAVIEMIVQRHAATGQVLDTDVAAQALEETLAAHLAKSKKFGPRGPAATPTTQSNGNAAPKQTGTTTLSAVHASEVPVRTDGSTLPLDPEERYRKVMSELGLA